MRLLRCTTLSAALLIAFTAHAQQGMPMPMGNQAQTSGKPLASPPATAETTLDGKKVTIKYNTPSMRGRKIMGELVPYDKVWRTGANAATTLITETPLKIGTLELTPGTYTLYTLPAAPGTPWQLIVNKQTGQWGTEYKQEMDLGRTPLTHKTLSSPQEVMSISFDDTHGKSTELHIRWETTDESVKVEAK